MTSARSVPCAACGGDAHLRLVARDVNRATSNESFPYYECRSCGLIFLSPVPEDLSRFYPAGYHAPPTRDALERAAEAESYKLEIVQRFRSSGRLAEIGPSWGGFVYLAKRAGFEVDAIEMDPRCCMFLRDSVGVNVVESSEPGMAIRERDPYDVIALWHVIEHLPDPWALLRTMAGKLNPGGILVLAAPNPSALQFRMMGRRWPHVDAPRHVALIPPGLLVRRAQQVGLTKELLTTRDRGSLGWNTFGWEQLLANLSGNHLAALVLRLAGRAVATVFSPLEGREGAGSAYTAVFRKEG